MGIWGRANRRFTVSSYGYFSHCSFRSKFEYDVSKIAEKFGGGGHKNAAGCLIIDSLSNAERMIIDAIKTYLKENG